VNVADGRKPLHRSIYGKFAIIILHDKLPFAEVAGPVALRDPDRFARGIFAKNGRCTLTGADCLRH
jgi:hypothetical protein